MHSATCTVYSKRCLLGRTKLWQGLFGQLEVGDQRDEFFGVHMLGHATPGAEICATLLVSALGFNGSLGMTGHRLGQTAHGLTNKCAAKYT